MIPALQTGEIDAGKLLLMNQRLRVKHQHKQEHTKVNMGNASAEGNKNEDRGADVYSIVWQAIRQWREKAAEHRLSAAAGAGGLGRFSPPSSSSHQRVP
jgi:hypothetical protein